MKPRSRKLLLTAHVVVSVGWLGAVAAFLALAVNGLTSSDPSVQRGAYLAMGTAAWFVIVPLSFASPLTGIVQSLTTQWGLFRHYWVAVKFFLTIPATLVLLLHMGPISQLASAAASSDWSATGLNGMQEKLAINAAAALIVLLITTALSIYKPGGLTAFGRRVLAGNADLISVTEAQRVATPFWVNMFWIAAVVVVAHVVILHLLGLGFHH